jgi:hypothetical protein
MDVPASATVASVAKTPLAGAISGHDTGADGLIPKPKASAVRKCVAC